MPVGSGLGTTLTKLLMLICHVDGQVNIAASSPILGIIMPLLKMC